MTFSFIVVVVGAIAIGLFMRRNRNQLPAQLARQLPEFIDAVVLLMFSGHTCSITDRGAHMARATVA